MSWESTGQIMGRNQWIIILSPNLKHTPMVNNGDINAPKDVISLHPPWFLEGVYLN